MAFPNKSRRPVLAAVLLAALGAALSAQGAGLPPDEAGARDSNTSRRHGEWISYDAGGGDKVDAFVVYPGSARWPTSSPPRASSP